METIDTFTAKLILFTMFTIFVLCGAYLALFPALALGLTQRLGAAGGWRWLAAATAAWLLIEWLRGWVFTGFPWLALGYSQVPGSPLAGYAPVLGVYGITGLMALSAAALAMYRAWPLMLVAAIWLGGWLLHAVEWTQPVGRPLTVSLPVADTDSSASRRIPTRPNFGTASLSNSSRFPLRSRWRVASPVIFPPGRAKLSMSRSETGSI